MKSVFSIMERRVHLIQILILSLAFLKVSIIETVSKSKKIYLNIICVVYLIIDNNFLQFVIKRVSSY